MTLKATLILGVAALAFSACDASKTNTATTNTANKSNTAVVTNANTTNTNTTTATNANTTSNTNSTASTDGSEIKIDDAGVVMTVPKGMSFSKEGADTIVKTDDDGVDTRFTVLSEDNMDKAVEGAFEEIKEYITDAKMDSKEPKKSTQNGLEVYSWEGTGKASNGDDVMFQLAISSIPDSPKKPLLALTYAEKESMTKHQADLMKFYQSIRKQ